MLERIGLGERIGRLGARHVATELRLSDGRPAPYDPIGFARAGQNMGIHRADLLGQLPPGTVPPYPPANRGPQARRT